MFKKGFFVIEFKSGVCGYVERYFMDNNENFIGIRVVLKIKVFIVVLRRVFL